MSGEVTDLNTTIAEQSKTIKTLADQISSGATEGVPDTYIDKSEKEPPNYLVYIGIGAILFLLIKRS